MTQAILPSLMEESKIRASNYMESSVEVGDDVDNIFNRLTNEDFVKPRSPLKRNSNEEKLTEVRNNKVNLTEGRKQEKKRRKIRRPGPYLRRKDDQRKAQRLRRMMMMTAPVNTTQFLMSDMNKEAENLSDYSRSSESEHDFANKEFSKDYEKETLIHTMKTKAKLIEEYMMIEKEVKLLEKKYEEMTAQETLKARLGQVDYDWEKGEIEMEPEIAEKIRIFQEEISKLATENNELQIENSRLVADNSTRREDSEDETDSDSSSDSESSDDDSSSESDSSSSGESDDDTEEEDEIDSSTAIKEDDNETKKNDTGYDSEDLVSSTTLVK